MVDLTLERKALPKPFGSPCVLALAVIAGPDLHAIYRIRGSQTVVGREGEADFALTDPQVSKRHIQIEVSASVYTLVDLGSRNGTQLNRRAVASGGRQRLKHLDEIQIGNSQLLFMVNRFVDRR